MFIISARFINRSALYDKLLQLRTIDPKEHMLINYLAKQECFTTASEKITGM